MLVQRGMPAHLAMAIENGLTSCPHPPMAFAIEDGWYPSRQAKHELSGSADGLEGPFTWLWDGVDVGYDIGYTDGPGATILKFVCWPGS